MTKYSDQQESGRSSKSKTSKRKNSGKSRRKPKSAGFEEETFYVGEHDDESGDDYDEEHDSDGIGEPWPDMPTDALEYADELEAVVRESSSGGFGARVVLPFDDDGDGRAEDRVPVSDSQSNPYDQICYLSITPPDGSPKFVGTGWLIGSRVIATAGHNVFNDVWKHGAGSGPALGVTAYFGRNGKASTAKIKAKAIQYKVPTEWTRSHDQAEEWDFAAIVLDDNVGDEVGQFEFAHFSDSDLKRMTVNIAGYPGDRDKIGFMYRHANRIAGVRPQRLEYTIDTSGGQSGCPVVCWHGGNNHVVGIHNYGNRGALRNYATRINEEVFEKMMEWRAL